MAAEDLTPHLAYIEVYGARRVSAEKVRRALGVEPGGLLPPREDLEERVSKVSGVTEARVEAVCCDGHNLVLYVGVADRESAHMEYHETPTGDLTLPPSLFSAYKNFLDEVSESIHGRNNDEDLTNGYSLMADPASRSLQQSFLPAVAQDLATVDRVLREAADPEQRAAAAYLLQYAPRNEHASKLMTDGLQYALRDPDDGVRRTAIRALKAVMVGAKLHPEQQVHIEPTWYIELMNSVVWSDRREASQALVDLTESRNPDTLALLRERALPSVIEMARWRQLQYALPPFILAGRMAGLDEAVIKKAWLSGERDDVLDQVLHSRKHKQAQSS
ncbi:MAG TPA: hypothetical protein VKX25_10725 [Bryobacteraceae bacterium]|jgi:hypothetical protein|nr:hypothetical protein [Bryobacteraceae bacterium]